MIIIIIIITNCVIVFDESNMYLQRYQEEIFAYIIGFFYGILQLCVNLLILSAKHGTSNDIL